MSSGLYLRLVQEGDCPPLVATITPSSFHSFCSEDDDLTSKLKDFVKRYDGKVNFDIRIAGSSYQQRNDVAWYQIFSRPDHKKFREELPFSGRYFWTLREIDEENLLRAINHFESILLHISEPKVMKKQKRNDDI